MEVATDGTDRYAVTDGENDRRSHAVKFEDRHGFTQALGVTRIARQYGVEYWLYSVVLDTNPCEAAGYVGQDSCSDQGAPGQVYMARIFAREASN